MTEFVFRFRRSTWALAQSLFCIGLICAPIQTAYAQEDDEEEDPETIEKIVEEFEKMNGLFPLYRDPETGDLFMEIGAEQLGEEFIAFSYTENGVVQAGHFRGAYRDQRIISFEKYYDRIEVVEQSTAFYFDPENALSRSKDANISPAVIAAVDIKATTEADDEEGSDRYLIPANKLFLTEALHKVGPEANPLSPGPGIGDVASDRTKYAGIRNYPENTDVIVDYVFANPGASSSAPDEITDPRSISIKVQHSLIKMPDDGFEPRLDDYRVGYFFDKVTDLTSSKVANYRDMINRWRLEKKEPDAELSEPVTPITWWIENSTPVEWRGVIEDAVLQWNQSFEKAGFKNAVVVKVQPDDADWDAGDIRYNVLRWTSSPTPPFGGYGPSFTNPRTGEIIGADIMLEYVFLTNRLALSKIFEGAGISANDGAAGLGDAPISLAGKSVRCSAGHHLQASTVFGKAMLQATGATQEDLDELTRQGMYYLLLHEVGHTLGLNHNMKASSRFGPREVHNAAITNGAPTGSVMDYPAVNLAPLGVEQGDYYMLRPGPYDDWAIEFGYHPNLDDPDAEKDRMAALLARSSEPGLTFGNDADDMRAPGFGIDPRVMINDMSSDPVAYGVDRIKLVKSLLPGLAGRFASSESWMELSQAFALARGQHASMAIVMTRQVGGIYVDRTAPAQMEARSPFTPVPEAVQKAAIKALSDYVYAGDAFEIPAPLAAKLQTQRRGFEFFGATEDPKLHAQVLAIQSATLDHLLHPVVMQRMVDSGVYGNSYSPLEMIEDLNEAIYAGDLLGTPNSYRRNLQIMYAEQLVAVANDYTGMYSPAAKAAALAGTDNLRSRLGVFAITLSAEAKAHRRHLLRVLSAV